MGIRQVQLFISESASFSEPVVRIGFVMQYRYTLYWVYRNTIPFLGYISWLCQIIFIHLQPKQ
nr:MAG TPA: hypothetical protein [Caudoviricetes sp.]